MAQPIPLPSDRSFGITFVVVFSLLAAWQAWHERWVAASIFAGLALLALAVALVRPAALRPLNRAWMRFGALLHRIVSPVVLGAMFFTVFTPLGFFMRLFGYDPMRRSLDRAAPSYWIARDPPGPPPDSLPNQF